MGRSGEERVNILHYVTHFLFHHFIISTPIHFALAYLAKLAMRGLGAVVVTSVVYCGTLMAH
jgi:hypothetical protein